MDPNVALPLPRLRPSPLPLRKGLSNDGLETSVDEWWLACLPADEELLSLLRYLLVKLPSSPAPPPPLSLEGDEAGAGLVPWPLLLLLLLTVDGA